jgi:hypothetical protein
MSSFVIFRRPWSASPGTAWRSELAHVIDGCNILDPKTSRLGRIRAENKEKRHR